MVGQADHRRHEVAVLVLPDGLDESQLKLVFADPLRTGEVDLQRRIRRLLLTDHPVLEPVAVERAADDVVQELEEVRLAGVEQVVVGPAVGVELRRLALRENFFWRLHHRLRALVVDRRWKQITNRFLKNYFFLFPLRFTSTIVQLTSICS